MQYSSISLCIYHSIFPTVRMNKESVFIRSDKNTPKDIL